MDEIKIGENENIETLFKVEPPLTELDGGYGYIGVVLRNKETDTIQCHTCGKWCKNLVNHFINAHKISNMDYRKKYGLPLHFPLVSKALSESSSKTALKNVENNIGCFGKYNFKKYNVVPSRKGSVSGYSKKNPSWDNKHGACDEQLKKRYEMVADVVGKEPAAWQIDETDPSLRFYIMRRHESLNKFREKFGYTVRPANTELTDAFCLSKLRSFLKTHKRLPQTKDFLKGRPNTSTIYTKFGSWNRALAYAGII